MTAPVEPALIVEDPPYTTDGLTIQRACGVCGMFQILDHGAARVEHLCIRDGRLVTVRWLP